MKSSFILFVFLTSFHSLLQMASIPYLDNFEEAIELSETSGKNILMIFSGSDWCRPCIQFSKQILQNESFINYAEEELIILYLDFPAKKKNKLSKEQRAHNESLAERFNSSGSFPKIILLDHEENILGKIDFRNQGPEKFVVQCKKILS